MGAFFKRISLFLVTNILIILTLSIVWTLISSFLGVKYTQGYTGLLIFCVIMGFGGSFISLLLSKTIAKMTYKVKIIPPDTRDSEARVLLQTVHTLARKAKINKMPEVGIYESPDINAFATGATKNSSLVAVSTGLLNSMSSDEIEGVLAHEVAHISNGDMVTMTLLQGIINAVVMFAARIIGNLISNALSRSDDGPSPWMTFGIVMLLQTVFSFFGAIVVSWFSRHREYRADYGGAQLASKTKMIAALRRLQQTYDPRLAQQSNDDSLAAFKISGKRASSIAQLFSTHPPLEERIKSLEQARVL